MIITLAGTVTSKGDGYAVIDVGGVGYQVFMHGGALDAMRVGAAASVWTHEYTRDDGRELYGFLTAADHRLFRRFLAVSGVGPRTAQHLLSLGAASEIEKRIETADIAWLCRVPGIGKKTAQKIVLELKGKLVDRADISGEDHDVVTALMNLGYSREKALHALGKVSAETASPEERLRASLKELGR